METPYLVQSRTVVVSGVPDPLPCCRMAEKLTVHFQSRRKSHGGDVEVVTYPTNMKGVAFVTFDHAADAERVVQKEQQTLTHSSFPEEYLLTVFPFTTDVFFYVASASVDLSTFDGDRARLLQSLRAAHRSLRFQVLSRGRNATVEGPFAAVRALREDLIRRAAQFRLPLPPAAVQPGEFPPYSRPTSHDEFVGPLRGSDFKAKRKAADSVGLSPQLQSTGEGREVQSRLSNAKPPNSARQSVQSVCDTGADEEEELKAGPRLRLASGCRGGGDDAGLRCSLSGLHLHPAEEGSTQQNERFCTDTPEQTKPGLTPLTARTEQPPPRAALGKHRTSVHIWADELHIQAHRKITREVQKMGFR